MRGDTLPLYSRTSSLRIFLSSKEATNRSMPEAIRTGALEALATLCRDHGRALLSSLQDVFSVAAKHITRYSPSTRCVCQPLPFPLAHCTSQRGWLPGMDRSLPSTLEFSMTHMLYIFLKAALADQLVTPGMLL